MDRKEIEIVYNKLLKVIASEGYKGYDPFDGLNSKYINTSYFYKFKYFRLFWLQFFKRSPINFRKFFNVSKGYNPKGLGLILTSLCIKHKSGIDQEKEIRELINLIRKHKNLSNDTYSGDNWGYNFDWQARAFFQPKWTPSVVVTSYVACSLIDAYEIFKDEDLLQTARSSCDFIMNDLNKTFDDNGNFCYSYSPLDKTQVYNASLLGVRLLCRVYEYTNETVLIDNAKKAIAYVCSNQGDEGEWSYSKLSFHSWIDNFHTGYNLECIYEYQRVSNDLTFNSNIENGLRYYLNTFFEESGCPKYYSNSKYPIDMHNTAQLIVTLSKLKIFNKNKELIDRVLGWSIDNMFNAKKGYFYYYRDKYFLIKISYLRWIQAWMLLGLSHYLYGKKD